MRFYLNESKTWAYLLFFCLASRLLSSIYYIEDPDSLRFVLGVLDYELARCNLIFLPTRYFALSLKFFMWLQVAMPFFFVDRRDSYLCYNLLHTQNSADKSC